MRDVGHQVDRVVPDDGDPRRLRQNLVSGALGDGGSACRRRLSPSESGMRTILAMTLEIRASRSFTSPHSAS